MKRTQCLAGAVAFGLLAACAVPGGTTSTASMTIPLNKDLQAISDVQGPYGAVSYARHAVAVRLWPDTLDNALAELTVIVTNGSWNTILLDVDNITLLSNGIKTPVLGQSSMLARTEVATGQSTASQAGTLSPRTESASTREASAPESGAAGSRLNTETGSISVDPALAAAARRANANRRPASVRSSTNLEEQREMIRDWYLEIVEIYPGDTGTGGISIPVPEVDSELELRIRIGEEDYVFPISYRTR